MKRTKLLAAVLACSASIGSSGTARAFDSKGHDVIEALAYRTLVEGHGERPPAPEILRDLINDGAIVAPVCFGDRAHQPAACRTAPVDNPLLEWPEPRTDRPDAAFRRQFSDPGQCYHFMATLEDEASAPLEGSPIPRALATTAVVRCRSLLDELVRQIVVIGGAGTRDGGRGLYELMHSVADSFSYAHAQRTATHTIAFLRTWEPIAKLAGGRLGAAYSMSPTRHAAHDLRDQAYVRNFVEVEGRPCKDLTDFPYDVPFACLSEEGDLARQALVELLVVVRRLRLLQLAAGSQIDTRPEQSEDWRTYKDTWFLPATPCQGRECEARQPIERVPSNDLLLGLSATYNPTRHLYAAAIRGMLLKYSWDLNPFLYGVTADVGFGRQYDDGTNYGVAALELDLFLPVGKRAAVGLAPAISGYAFGSSAHSGPQLLSQALRVDAVVGRNVWIEAAGPMQIDWITARFEWSFGLTVGFAPSAKEIASDRVIQLPVHDVERRDEAWSPPPLWYGRIKGREPSWYLVGSTSPELTPSSALPGRFYGGSVLGAAVSWDRDSWGKRYPTAYGGSLEFGLRNTSADFRYVTGVVGIELRWYPVSILGVSFVPVRLEAGPRVTGAGVDSSPDVHTYGGNQYYVQVGSRLGLAFSAGLVDLLLQAPTLPWRSDPWNTGELLTFQLGIKL
jgi:hypothetical protein